MRTRLMLHAVLLVLGAACARAPRPSADFVVDEPIPTRLVVTGSDTLFVLSTPAYDLISRRRTALWQKRTVDDVAWQYRRMFGGLPPHTALVLLDSQTVRREELIGWLRVPMGMVRHDEPIDGRSSAGLDLDDGEHGGGGWPTLPNVAAQTWLLAVADQRGPPRRDPQYPSWFVAGVTTLLTARGLQSELTAETRSRIAEAIPLDSLFGVVTDDRLMVAHDRSALDPMLAGASMAPAGGSRNRRGRRASGPFPLFDAQAVAVLEFMHARDPAFVATLPAALAAGRSMAELLPASAKLPHTVAALDAEWRRWLRTRPRRGSA